MTTFYTDYKNKIQTILKIKDKISGTHEIDIEKANKWVNSQLTLKRRNAAMNLINNTHYITFNQLFEHIRNSVIDIYKNLNLNNNIYIYIKDKKSSFYFMGMIALYFIKLLKYKEPIPIEKLRSNIQILMFDDCSYSGVQMHQLLMDKGTNFNIFLGLSCITERASRLIQGTAIVTKSTINVFPTFVIGSLENLDRNIYNDIIYYFSPYTEGQTKVSLYFDHKIAEPISTFLKVINFGPILPKNLNYDYELLKRSLIFTHNDEFGIMSEERFNTYYKEMLDEEKSIPSQQNKIKFIPFINNCEPILTSLENIKYGLLQISYLNYNQNMDEYESELDIIDLINDPNNRCINSFYKTLF